jgi:hypothetical protein
VTEEKHTQSEAHKLFARQFNGETWSLLAKADRTKADDERMIYSALASCRHWLEVGTGAHHQRGEWLIARVYSMLDMPAEAVRHALRCLELAEEHTDLMEDFDRAYAFEGVARAHAVAGNADEARKYIELAQEAGKEIADEESKKLFIGDLEAGDWKGHK